MYLPKELIRREQKEEQKELPSPFKVRELHQEGGGDEDDGAVLLEFAPQKKVSDGESTGNDAGTKTVDDEHLILEDAPAGSGISIREGMRFCGGKTELYRELLRDYAKDCREKSGNLESNYQAHDWEAYRILIHAIKSGSKTIGAGELAELALKLENASKIEDSAYIEAHHAAFIVRYKRTAEKIAAALLQRGGRDDG